MQRARQPELKRGRADWTVSRVNHRARRAACAGAKAHERARAQTEAGRNRHRSDQGMPSRHVRSRRNDVGLEVTELATRSRGRVATTGSAIGPHVSALKSVRPQRGRPPLPRVRSGQGLTRMAVRRRWPGRVCSLALAHAHSCAWGFKAGWGWPRWSRRCQVAAPTTSRTTTNRSLAERGTLR